MSAVFLYAIEGIQLFSPVLTDVVVVDNVYYGRFRACFMVYY